MQPSPVLIERVQGDTAPNHQFTVTRGAAQTIVNLTGYTVRFFIKDTARDLILNAAHTACTITNPTGGVCQYAFVAGDLAGVSGQDANYYCDLQLTDANGAQETYLNAFQLFVRASNATT